MEGNLVENKWKPKSTYIWKTRSECYKNNVAKSTWHKEWTPVPTTFILFNSTTWTGTCQDSQLPAAPNITGMFSRFLPSIAQISNTFYVANTRNIHVNHANINSINTQEYSTLSVTKSSVNCVHKYRWSGEHSMRRIGIWYCHNYVALEQVDDFLKVPQYMCVNENLTRGSLAGVVSTGKNTGIL
jgi:hypothetical protein